MARDGDHNFVLEERGAGQVSRWKKWNKPENSKMENETGGDRRHGRLARSCCECDLERRVAELTTERDGLVEAAKDQVRIKRDLKEENERLSKDLASRIKDNHQLAANSNHWHRQFDITAESLRLLKKDFERLDAKTLGYASRIRELEAERDKLSGKFLDAANPCPPRHKPNGFKMGKSDRRGESPAADSARLDWLDEANRRANARNGTVYGWRVDVNHNRMALTDHNLPALSVRQAIDETMARWPASFPGRAECRLCGGPATDDGSARSADGDGSICGQCNSVEADKPASPDGRDSQDFLRDLGSAVNRASRENASNTPDFILADLMADCLAAFERASRARELWYGKGLRIGGVADLRVYPKNKED